MEIRKERKQTCAKQRQVAAPESNYYPHFIADETETQVRVQQASTGNLLQSHIEYFYIHCHCKPSQESLS